jgi:hypothetical protein
MLSAETISDVIGLLVAGLYTVAGQAHFTARITPGLAETVELMTPNTHRAIWFLGVDYLTVRHFFPSLRPLGPNVTGNDADVRLRSVSAPSGLSI